MRCKQTVNTVTSHWPSKKYYII